SSGMLRIDLQGSGVGGSGQDLQVIEPGQWVYFQAKVFYGGSVYTAQVKIDDTAFPVHEDPDEVPSHVRSQHYGTGSAKTYRCRIRHPRTIVASEELEFFDIPAGPLAGDLPVLVGALTGEV